MSPKRRMSQTSMVDMMKESGEHDNEAEISGRARTHTHTHTIKVQSNSMSVNVPHNPT